MKLSNNPATDSATKSDLGRTGTKGAAVLKAREVPIAEAAYCTGLALLAGVVLWLVFGRDWMNANEFKEELVKTTLQILVFGLAGGGIKLLLDRQKQQREFRAATLQRFGDAHKKVYRVRRLLALTKDVSEQSKLLGDVMDVRQDLGHAYHAARIWGLGGRVAKIQDATDVMRAYLEEVIEAAAPSANSDHRRIYDEFLDCVGPCPSYLERFKVPYLEAKRLVDPSWRETKKARTTPPVSSTEG